MNSRTKILHQALVAISQLADEPKAVQIADEALTKFEDEDGFDHAAYIYDLAKTVIKTGMMFGTAEEISLALNSEGKITRRRLAFTKASVGRLMPEIREAVMMIFKEKVGTGVDTTITSASVEPVPEPEPEVAPEPVRVSSAPAPAAVETIEELDIAELENLVENLA